MTKLFNFKKRISSLPSDLWLKISEIDEIKGSWNSGTYLPSHILERIKKDALIDATQATHNLSGTTLLKKEVREILSSPTTATTPLPSVRNYHSLLSHVHDHWHDYDFDIATITLLQEQMLRDIETEENKAHVHIAQINDFKVKGVILEKAATISPQELAPIVHWTHTAWNERTHHPLPLIAQYLFEMLQKKIFGHENLSVAFLTTTVLLQKAGYHYVPYVALEHIFQQNKRMFHDALLHSNAYHTTSKKELDDITPWLTFCINAFYTQAQVAFALDFHEDIDMSLSEKQNTIWMLIKEKKKTTPREIASLTNIPRPTINQALEKLLRHKKIQRLGKGRATQYLSVE